MLEKMLALQNKRKKEGGFTLVELIVVLVILAILAALLIPALTGYIQKAKDKQITAECRQAVMAAQTLYDEEYGAVKTANGKVTFDVKTTETTSNDGVVSNGDIAKLAEVPVANISGKPKANDDGKISKLVYKTDNRTCTYNGSTYSVEADKTGN